jgi:hypothetical protein
MNKQKSRGLTSEWIEHRRADDNELIGFLVPDGECFLPVTVFGYPIAATSAREAAEEELDQGGLRYLAERWTLQLEGQSPIQVEIVEANPQKVVVKNVDFSSGLDHGTRFTIQVPLNDQLTLP